MIVLAAIGLVCVTLLGALVLVLHHLAAMRATTGEMAALDGVIRVIQAQMKDFESRLTIINNRRG